MAKLPILERLYRHVEKDENDCWNWTAATFRASGYGAIRVDRQTRYAHRVSFQAHGLGDPTGYFVCHRCDNRLCINPDHLFWVLQKITSTTWWVKIANAGNSLELTPLLAPSE